MHKYSIQMSCLHWPDFNRFLSPAHYLIGMNVGCQKEVFGRCYDLCWVKYYAMSRKALISCYSKSKKINGRALMACRDSSLFRALLIQKLLRNLNRSSITSSGFTRWGAGQCFASMGCGAEQQQSQKRLPAPHSAPLHSTQDPTSATACIISHLSYTYLILKKFQSSRNYLLLLWRTKQQKFSNCIS